MKVLVTGSEGFIGSHLIEALVKNKYKVRALVLYNSFNSWGWLDSLSPEIKKKIEVKLGDVRDSENINQNIKDVDVSSINLGTLLLQYLILIQPQGHI